MERYELLNKLLAPVDFVLDLNINVLRKLNLYDPLTGLISSNTHKLMLHNFKRTHNLEVIGTENLPKSGGYLLAVNHQSWLDAQVLAVALPVKVRFVAKSMLYDFPVLKQLMEMEGAFQIKRGGDPEGLQRLVDALKAGDVVAIFPEGTIPGEEDIPRSAVEKDTGLLQGRTGVVRLALQANVPIVPIGVSGTGQAFPPEAYPRLEQLPLIKPAPITIRVGQPLTFTENYETVTKEALRDLTKTVMLEISKLVDFSRSYQPYQVPVTNPPWEGEKPMKSLPSEVQDLGVLVLHGFTSSIKTVDGLEPYLQKLNLPYIFPILRGHGTKYQDLEGVTHQDWYADAEAALLELHTKANRIVVVGLSMGGLVTLELAMNHADKLAGIVLVAPALKFQDPLAGMTGLIKKVIKFWPSPNSFNDLELKKNCRNYPKFATSAFASLYDYAKLIHKDLAKVTVPTLILQSKKDQVVAPAAAQTIHDQIKSAVKRLVWFEKSGHEMMQDLEAPAVLATIEQFIKEQKG